MDSFFPKDLALLLYYLTKMPNIKRMRLVGDRWNYMDNRYYSALDSRQMRQSIRAQREGRGHFPLTVRNELPWCTLCAVEAHYINLAEVKPLRPLSWSRGNNLDGLDEPRDSEETYRAWFHGLFILTQALSMLKIDSIQSFETGSVNGDLSLGLPYWGFQMSSTELSHVAVAFRSLKEHSLQVNTLYFMNNMMFNDQHITRMITSAPRLRRLSLGFDLRRSFPTPTLSRLFTVNFTWDCLEHIQLTNFRAIGEDLITFLEKRQDSLKTLTLQFSTT